MGVIDNKVIEIKCPNCRKKIKEKIRKIKQGFKCPSCTTSFNANQFKREIDKIEKELAKLVKGINIKL